MKLKYILLACSFALAALLGGCGTSASTQPSAPAEPEPPVEEAEQPVEEAEQLPEETEADPLLAYREILKAAPAIEGEHEELTDPSFGYEENLELFGEHYDLFALSDINHDEIPELIALSVINARWNTISVYTYADGNAVLLKDPANAEAHITFDQQSTANGAYITYICEENHIHNVWRGTTPMGEAAEENYAYELVGTTLTAVDCTVGESEHTVYFHDVAIANTAENADAITL